MKKFIYWLMGARAGQTLAGIWSWLWGIPVQSGNRISVEVAQESLHSMQETVFQLTETVSLLVAAYQKAKAKYEVKEKEFHDFENQAALAYHKGNEEAARLAMSKAILIEQLLPQLKSQVDQGEKVVIAAKGKLNREQQKLETYKIQMRNLKDLSEINESLAAIAKVNKQLELELNCSQFEDAQAAVQKRNFQILAQAELSENPTQRLESDLERLTLDEQIAQRLKSLNTSKLN